MSHVEPNSGPSVLAEQSPKPCALVSCMEMKHACTYMLCHLLLTSVTETQDMVTLVSDFSHLRSCILLQMLLRFGQDTNGSTASVLRTLEAELKLSGWGSQGTTLHMDAH